MIGKTKRLTEGDVGDRTGRFDKKSIKIRWVQVRKMTWEVLAWMADEDDGMKKVKGQN